MTYRPEKPRVIALPQRQFLVSSVPTGPFLFFPVRGRTDLVPQSPAVRAAKPLSSDTDDRRAETLVVFIYYFRFQRRSRATS